MAPAASAAPNARSTQLACFDGASEGNGNGTCVANPDGSYTLTIHEGANGTDYAGVYLLNKSLAGKALSGVTLAFDYVGTTGGGAPRFSIPLASGGYLFIDVAADTNHDGTASTTDTGAIVSAPGFYGTWSEFLAAYPTATVGSGTPFVIFNWAASNVYPNPEGSVTVSHIVLGNAKH